MNRLPLSVFAACLMRSLALGTPSRPCVRGVFCGPAFPLACRLPSTPSADVVRIPLGAVGFPWLSPAFPPSCPTSSAIVLAFASFVLVQKSRRYYAAVRLPDPCISGSRPWTSHCGPRRHPPRAVCRVSRFSRMVLPRMLGVSSSTAPGPSAPLHSWCIRCCLRPQKKTRHLEGELDFAAQYPACVCPCQRFGRALTRTPT